MAMIKFVAPALPLPPPEYNSMYQTDLIRILRLYFNQLDSNTPLAADYFKGRGDQLLNPHITASDSTDQYADGDNDPTVVKWNTLESRAGFTLNPDNSATVPVSGRYKINYSLQFVNTDNVSHDVYVWLQVNGGPLANSTSRFSIPARKSAGVYSYLIAYSSVLFNNYKHRPLS